MKNLKVQVVALVGDVVSSVVRQVVGLDPELVAPEPEGVGEEEDFESVTGLDSLELEHVEPEGVGEQENSESVIGLDSLELEHVEPEGVGEQENSKPVPVGRLD
jgi:hypothetical protein